LLCNYFSLEYCLSLPVSLFSLSVGLGIAANFLNRFDFDFKIQMYFIFSLHLKQQVFSANL
jgi:hypothetical protein